MIRLGIDIMGGDFAPNVVLEGISSYLKANNTEGVEFWLYGNERSVSGKYKFLKEHPSIKIIHTEAFFTMDDSPIKALQSKPNASILLGLQDLRDKKINCMSSAGNTGGVMVGIHKFIPTIEGIKRPCIATAYKNIKNTRSIVLDSGLLPEVKAVNLNEFAILGSCFAKSVFGVENPKVGLINIGKEKTKGTSTYVEAHNIMAENRNINFVGNVEADKLFLGEIEVFVCDGFIGNVIIKLSGSIKVLLDKFGGKENQLSKLLDYETYGGAPVLGIGGNVIIAHGKSSGDAICQMIGESRKISQSALTESIKSVINKYYGKG